MHPNPAFRDEDHRKALEVARARGFGILTVAGPDGVLASHVPFVIEHAKIGAHLVRSNPIARLLKKSTSEALLIVSGPDAYISPDWYEVDDQVPTWNYVAVHIRGNLRLLSDEALEPHLERLSQHNEQKLLPKKPWHHDKMSDGVMDKMMRQIVPVEMTMESIDQTWKLNQNKSAEARQSAASLVAGSPIGTGQSDLARLMRGVPDN
jgi:transcriptional regulator